MLHSALRGSREYHRADYPSGSGHRLSQEVRILYELMPVAQWFNLITAVILFGVLYQHIEEQALLRWVTFFLFIIAIREVISINYKRAELTSENEQFWFNWFLVGTTLYGIMWSGTAIYLVPSESAIVTGFTGLILAALAAGSVAISAVSIKVYMLYAFSTLGPYAGLLISSNQYPQLVIGWLMLVYFAVLTIMAVHVNRFFSNYFRLQLESDELEKEVQYQNQKRKLIEKAMLDNTLEEEIAESIRHQAKSLRNELRTPISNDEPPAKENRTDNINSREYIIYRPYLEKFNNLISGQLLSIASILFQFKNSNLSDEQRKNVALMDKLLYGVTTSINKLNVFEPAGDNIEALQTNRINIRRLLLYITHEIPLLYKSKLITVKRNISQDIPQTVYGDDTLLKAVLNQLILNAFQNMDGGIIEINVTKKSENDNEITMYFEISDTGIGISREVLDKFLDENLYDDSELMGLMTVKRYVNRLKGKVFASSILGVGTKIGFSIPLMKENELTEA